MSDVEREMEQRKAQALEALQRRWERERNSKPAEHAWHYTVDFVALPSQWERIKAAIRAEGAVKTTYRHYPVD